MLCLKRPHMDVVQRKIVLGDIIEEDSKTKLLSECLSTSKVVSTSTKIEDGLVSDKPVSQSGNELNPKMNNSLVYQTSNGTLESSFMDTPFKPHVYSFGNEFPKPMWNRESNIYPVDSQFQFNSLNGDKNGFHDCSIDGYKFKGKYNRKNSEGSPKFQKTAQKRSRRSMNATDESYSPGCTDVTEKSEDYCHASLLIVQQDQELKEKDALIEMKTYQNDQRMLTVSLNGKVIYTVKAESPGASVVASRYSSYMTWKGEREWRLEFENRKEWTAFCHMHEFCFQKNGKGQFIRQIPIPGVTEVKDYYSQSNETKFDFPIDSYIHTTETEIQLVLSSKRVIYDLDSEDEEWLTQTNAEKSNLKSNPSLNQDCPLDQTDTDKSKSDSESKSKSNQGCRFVSPDLFELLIDKLEKESFIAGDVVSLSTALTLCRDFTTEDVITVVHFYWLNKRIRLGMPLSRYFQPLPWERYEAESKAWEGLLQQKMQETSGKSRQQLEDEHKRPAYYAFCMRPRALCKEKNLKQKSHKKSERFIYQNSLSPPVASPKLSNEPAMQVWTRPKVDCRNGKGKMGGEEFKDGSYNSQTRVKRGKKKNVDIESFTDSSPIEMNSYGFNLPSAYTPVRPRTSINSVLSLPSSSPSPSPLVHLSSFQSSPSLPPSLSSSTPSLSPFPSNLTPPFNNDNNHIHTQSVQKYDASSTIHSQNIQKFNSGSAKNNESNDNSLRVDFYSSVSQNQFNNQFNNQRSNQCNHEDGRLDHTFVSCSLLINKATGSKVEPIMTCQKNESYDRIHHENGEREKEKEENERGKRTKRFESLEKLHTITSNTCLMGLENGNGGCEEKEDSMEEEKKKKKRGRKKIGKQARRDRVQAAVIASKLNRMLRKNGNHCQMMEKESIQNGSIPIPTGLVRNENVMEIQKQKDEDLIRYESSILHEKVTRGSMNGLVNTDPLFLDGKGTRGSANGSDWRDGSLFVSNSEPKALVCENEEKKKDYEGTVNAYDDEIIVIDEERLKTEKNVLSTYQRKHKRGSNTQTPTQSLKQIESDNLVTMTEFSASAMKTFLRRFCNGDILQCLDDMEKEVKAKERENRERWEGKKMSGSDLSRGMPKDHAQALQYVNEARFKAYEAARMAEKLIYEAEIAKNHAIKTIGLAKALALQVKEDDCATENPVQKNVKPEDLLHNRPVNISEPVNVSEPVQKPGVPLEDKPANVSCEPVVEPMEITEPAEITKPLEIIVPVEITKPANVSVSENGTRSGENIKDQQVSVDLVQPNQKPRGRKRKAQHLLIKPRRIKPRENEK